MKIRFLTGACVLITSGETQLLTDPWLEDGEYYGSWCHYPPYKWDVDLSKVKYIYISHIHPDHFSVKTLPRLPKVPVLIHKFNGPVLKKAIEAQGFQVIELPHGDIFDMGGMSLQIYAADDCDPAVCQAIFGCPIYQIDTMAAIYDGESCIIDVNDCPYQLSQKVLKRVKADHPNVDLVLSVYGGAGAWPQCYDMPEEIKIEMAAKKERLFLDNAIAFTRDLGGRVLPFATDYVLAGRLGRLNPYRGVPDRTDAYLYFISQGCRYFGIDNGEEKDVKSQGNGIFRPKNGRAEYIAGLSEHRYDYDDDPPVEPDELTGPLSNAIARFLERKKDLRIDLQTRITVNGCPLSTGPKGLDISVNSKLLRRLLEGPRRAHWNNAEIGSHLRFKRSAGYEPMATYLLNFLHQ